MIKLVWSVRRGPCSFHSLRVMSVFLASVGYKGAIAAGRAAARVAEASETKGRVAKETFRVSLPGAGVWALPGVGVEGAVTDALVDSDTRGNLLVDKWHSQRRWIEMSQDDDNASGVLRQYFQTGTMGLGRA